MSSNKGMRVFIGTILVLLSLFIAGAAYVDLGFWMKPSEERLSIIWERDLNNLKTLKRLPAVFQDIGKIEVSSPDARIAEWLDKVKIPIAKKKDGNHLLQIMVIQWIEGNKYGVVIQYDVLDMTQENNKVFELGRTFHVGYMW